jgi:hypothetical protein
MNIGNTSLSYAILAPQGARIPGCAVNINHDNSRYARLLTEMQRMRGRVALQENAITPNMLDFAGRHVMPGDEKGWHLVRLHGDGKVVGCARILVHPRNVLFQGLRIAASAVARCANWAHHVQKSVESDLSYARRHNVNVIEPGGWVIDEELRGTREAVSMAISAFAWAQVLGDCIGYLTATVKNSSSAILRRLGGRNLQNADTTIPRFFEPSWGCDMELLRFDTKSLNPRFDDTLGAVRHLLLNSPVVSPDAAAEFALAA